MAEATKETIYIDVDDEITSIIEKLQSSKHKIVALVLPKRAAVLQSIVNMKLLKRAATHSKKNIVLITSEAGLLPLAGAVGLHVAKTLSSKPEIPPTPNSADDSVDVEDAIDGSVDTSEPKNITSKNSRTKAKAEDEPIDIEASDEEVSGADDESTASDKSDKKLKIPNFEKFRIKLIIGAVAFVCLVIGWYIAYFVVPAAAITIKTDNQAVTVDLPFTASTTIKLLDQEKAIVPAVSKETKKTDTEKVAATGKKNVGDKAKGTVSLQNCVKTDGPVTVPAGTTVSNNGNVFVVDIDSSLPASSFTGGGTCKTASKAVPVTAQNAGDQYNLSGGRVFTVSGFNGINGTDSSAMSGGTTKNVTVVSQDDINNAKNKLADKSKDTAKEELKKTLGTENLFPLIETFAFTDPAVTTSPNVGDESSDVSVTSVITYTMLGVKRDDLKALVVTVANKQIDTSKQSISSDGLDKAIFRLNDKGDGKSQKLNVQTEAETGTQLNEDDIKKQVTGKKSGDIQQQIQGYPGVKEVNVKFSPFWVNKAPKKLSKITITVERTKANDQNQ